MQLTGLGVSPGIGIGRALVVTRGSRRLRFRIPDHRIAAELERLHLARASARDQIARIKQRITDAAGTEHAYIFEAQRLMLDDPMLVDRAAEIVRGEREVDGKSIMALLLLAAAHGSSIRISADGADEDEAIAALCALIERGFDETRPQQENSCS